MKKTFSILLTVLLCLSLLIVACTKQDPTPVDSDTQGGDVEDVVTESESATEADIDDSETETETETETEEEIPEIDLGVNTRPVVTQPVGEDGVDTKYQLDSDQMSPSEEEKLTEDSEYWETYFGQGDRH